MFVYQLVSFAFEVSKASANIFNCSVWKCTQGQIEAVPSKKAFVGLG